MSSGKATRNGADNDARMLEIMGHAITDLQVKFRNCTLQERVEMRPLLEDMLEDYARYSLRLLKEGIITTDEQIAEMEAIKKEIDRAASKQAVLAAIAKTIAFVATKI